MVRKTIAGVLPDEWKGTLIKNICRVVRGSSPRPAGSPLFFDGNFLPWATVADLTNSDDMYLTSTKSMLTEAGAERTRITDPGTLMLTNSGATLGVPKISSIRCGANDGIAMLLELDGIVTEYAYYYLASKTQYFRDVIAPGVGQPNLNTDLIGDFPIPMPPLAEQKKIAQILSSWDKAITTTEQLLANSQQQKKVLRKQLLTGKKRFPEFNGKCERKELGELLEYKQPTPYLVKSTDYNDDYETPVLTAGKTFILGYTNELEGIYREKLPVIIFDDFTTDSKFVDFSFKVKSSAMKILTAREGVSIKYIFEAMQMLDFNIGGHQRHWISIFSKQVIAIPEIAEQRKIAAALSCADGEIETLKQKINHLKQEKKALMQQLLTGKRRVKVDAA